MTITEDVLNSPLDDTLVRTNKYTNDCGFDLDTLKLRTIQIAELQKMYPNMPYDMLEVSWNWCQANTLEYQNECIASGNMNLPSSRNGKGGLIKNAITIETPA
jgi:hypothetical protein